MLDHGIFKGFQSFPSPSHYSRLSAGYCSTGADEALQRRAAGRGAVCFREEDHVCCPHGVRHRPRASVLVRDQHDEDALRKKQMPLVQNKVTLSRTILGMSMTPCTVKVLARTILFHLPVVSICSSHGQVPCSLSCSLSCSPSQPQHPACAKCH